MTAHSWATPACRALARAALPLGLLLGLPLAASLGAAAPARAEMDLTELSLEQLLDQQLDQMAITGIHHTHDQGEWMVGYHFMYMDMDGNRDGTSGQSVQDVFDDGFAVAPRNMYMEMHMLHAMYGVSDDLTAMVVVPYVRKAMDHVRMDGARFTTRSRGLGDIRLAGLYSLYDDDTHQLIALGGVSFPTGSIGETDDLPGMMGMPGSTQRLPYPMQLGSGTFDLIPGATYLGQVVNWGWGAHAQGTVRLDENRYDYRLGNEYEVSSWGARKITRWSSGSLRLRWKQWFDIHGRDDALNPNMVPTADPDRRAGRRLDLLFGANLFAAEGRFEGLRLMVEAGLPVYQRLDGPQLETDSTVSVTLEWTL